MSLTLHRDGIAAIMQTLTEGEGAIFAAGFEWDHRQFADDSTAYPFWSLAVSIGGSEDPLTSGGAGGLNDEYVTTRLLLIDKYTDTKERYTAFLALADATLTALRADANINLGQSADGCMSNRVRSKKLSFVPQHAPPLIVYTIDLLGRYLVERT